MSVFRLTKRSASSAELDGRMADHVLLARSGLFDAAYYARENPDVIEAGWDPLDHYLQTGFLEGREPSPFFDGRGYLRRYSDLALSGLNPLVHWLRSGAREGRVAPVRASASSGSDYELLAASGLFDPAHYVREYPDVSAAGIDPISHYLEQGHREGRQPSAFFDAVAYEEQHPGLRAAGVNPLVHWLRFGAAEGKPAPVRGAAAPVAAPLTDHDIVERSGLFDRKFYGRSNPDIGNWRLDPVAHYLDHGFREGREPAAFFDGKSYVANNPDVEQAGFAPLVHWIRFGLLEERTPPFRDLADPVQKAEAERALVGADRIALDAFCDPTRDELGQGGRSGELTFSVLTPTFNTDPRYLRELYQTIRNQTYGNWEWVVVDDGSGRPETLNTLRRLQLHDKRVKVQFSESNEGISKSTNIALAQARGDYVILVDHDDLIPRTTFDAIYQAIQASPETEMFYTDECKVSETGDIFDESLKPGWSPTLLENTMYIGHLTGYKRKLLTDLGGLRTLFDGTQDYDLALRASKVVRHVKHLPMIGYLWRASSTSTAAGLGAKPYAIKRQEVALGEFARSLDPYASVAPGFSAGYWRTCFDLAADSPLLSYVIPTGGGSRTLRGQRTDLILNCIRSFEATRFYPRCEYIVVHNGDLTPEQVSQLRSYSNVRLVHYADQTFNLARKLNLGAAAAQGELLCLLNDDVEAITEKGGEELIAFLLAHPKVGMIGPMCLFESGDVQHNGMILLEQGPSHAGLLQKPDPVSAVGNLLRCRREVFGVTGAIAFLRRADYERLGGFDEGLPLNYNDVDFCLRLRASGLTCVVDPAVRVYHYESATKVGTFKCEKELLSTRWPDIQDPYFNPGYYQRDPSYRIAPRREPKPVELDPIAFENWLDRQIAGRLAAHPSSGSIKLSICVPVYNQPENFLEEMLQSCLSQTYQNREIVLVDDGSTLPETLRWLGEVERVGRARVVRHGHNKGIAGANRTWLLEATGEFVLPLDADDFLTIDALQVMAHWIERFPDRCVFYSDEFKSDPGSAKANPFFKPDFDPFLSANACYHTHLMAWRRDLLVELGAYEDDRATWCHDWDALGRAWARGHEPVHVPELLYAWRVSPGSTASAETGTKPDAVSSQRFVLDRLVKERGLERSIVVEPNELGANTGMWSLRGLRPVESVRRFKASEFWAEGERALLAAAESEEEWLALLTRSADDGEALLELSALALWDDRLDVVSGLLTDPGQSNVQWSGAFFSPDGLLVEPYAGRPLNRSYHGQLHTQRCVDVAAPTNVLIRINALRALLGEHGSELSSDAALVLLGLEAARRKRLVAITPYLKEVWRSTPAMTLPLDKANRLASVDPDLLRSRWYDPRLTHERAFGIDPDRWRPSSPPTSPPRVSPAGSTNVRVSSAQAEVSA